MIITQKEVMTLKKAPFQLARLVRNMWSDEHGNCYFPYKPLTTQEYWEEVAMNDWLLGKVMSRFWLDANGDITACASMIDKGGYWELGRFNSYQNNPKGTMFRLVADLKQVADIYGWNLVCETTQCHTSSQYIASKLGLRFAGYGFFAYVEDVPWDIIYFDNYDDLDFVSDENGLVNNVLGVKRFATSVEMSRLDTIQNIISIDQHSGFPPTKFHVYDKYLSNIETILSMNMVK